MQHPVSEQHCLTHALIHTFLLFCGQAALLTLAMMAALWFFKKPILQPQMVWNFSKSDRADLNGVGVSGKYSFSMHVLWVSSCTVRDPYMKGIWNNQKRRLATVLHPLLPSLRIQQEMPEAETALWLFFDSSNRWFPMEQVSLLICPSPTFFFFLLTRKWFIP